MNYKELLIQFIFSERRIENLTEQLNKAETVKLELENLIEQEITLNEVLYRKMECEIITDEAQNIVNSN